MCIINALFLMVINLNQKIMEKAHTNIEKPCILQ